MHRKQHAMRSEIGDLVLRSSFTVVGALLTLPIALLLAAPVQANVSGTLTASRSAIVALPLPQPTPAVIHEPCPGFPDVAGCYIGINQADVNGQVYVTGAIFTPRHYRFGRWHEFGHAFDDTMMDASEREHFSHILHLRDLAWTWSYEEDGILIQDPGTLAEKFADAYANCLLNHQVAPGRIWEAGYGYYPTARQHRRVCALVTDAAQDRGAPVAADGSR